MRKKTKLWTESKKDRITETSHVASLQWVLPNSIYKFVQVYLNPKVASSSIKEMLSLGSFKDGSGILDWWAVPRDDMPDTMYKEKTFRFGFVRNPYERAFSSYIMFKTFKKQFEWRTPGALEYWRAQRAGGYEHLQGLKHRVPHLLFEKDKKSLDTFENYIDFLRKEEEENCTWSAAKDTHVQRQINFFPEKEIDFIGKIESFARDWNKLENLLGIDLSAIIKRQPASLTITGTLIEKKQMSESTAAKIRSFYKEDFEKFSYNIEDYGEIEIV